MIYSAEEIYDWSVKRQVRPGVWKLARPESFGIFIRIKAAWLVLTGQADAVIWEDE